MSNNYNFDEIVADSPTIKMGGYEYRLVYPTVEDIERIQAMKTDEERNDSIYQFVEKSRDDIPPFRETLRKQNIKVLLAFTEMIKKEFGVE